MRRKGDWCHLTFNIIFLAGNSGIAWQVAVHASWRKSVTLHLRDKYARRCRVSPGHTARHKIRCATSIKRQPTRLNFVLLSPLLYPRLRTALKIVAFDWHISENHLRWRVMMMRALARSMKLLGCWFATGARCIQHAHSAGMVIGQNIAFVGASIDEIKSARVEESG